ncbi:DNA topoisomerase I, mitochondrial isoform X2 [Pogona vitticeps]
MEDVEEPLLVQMPRGEPSLRNMKQHPKVNKRSRRSRKKGPAKGKQDRPCEGEWPALNNPDKVLSMEEKPLQENTISSSQKLEEAGGNQGPRKKTGTGNGVMQKETSKHQQEKAESSPSNPGLAEQESPTRDPEADVDFAECNGHRVSCLRAEPVIKKVKLEPEQSVCETGDKLVPDQKGKEASPCLGTEGAVVEERKEKKKGSGPKQERGGREGPEEKLEGHSEARTVAEEDSEGAKDRKDKKLPKDTKTQGKERKSAGEKQVKGEQESEEDSGVEMVRRLCGKEEEEEEEAAMVGGTQAEGHAGRQKLAKRKRSRAKETIHQDGKEEKSQRNQGQRGPRKAESRQGARKRKAEEDGDPTKRKKKRKEENGECKANAKEERWKWWEEEKHEDGVKWHQLEHKGPYFAPPYHPLPDGVNFYYNGKRVKLTPAAEEVATFYAKMLSHEYTTKKVFQDNFFNDWIKEMTPVERKKIKDLGKCDFTEIHKYFVDKQEAQKALPKEEKQKLKEEAEKIMEEYGYCIIDGHREKIGNFKTEPPGLFRGRGDHPKMGMLKKRVLPEDVIINCSKDSKIPQPPPGHTWKEVRCDNTVTWLASWTENIQGSIKYVMLNPSSKLKGEKDWQKYEVARRLKGVVEKIRAQYRADWKSKEMKKRQRSVALYFIDRLALRAGNEKEEGETADTVGCCSLRVEHVTLHPRLNGKENVVEFDFLGKDCIRYYNKVPVEKQVFKNLQLFMENKEPGDDVFDRLSTASLNKHLQDLMDGLTAKVFRTYNASITLQEQLEALTNEEDNVAAKLLSYNRANRAVAILCNHQRATPKTFEKSMQTLQSKIDAKKKQVKEAKAQLKKAKADRHCKKDVKSKAAVEKKKKMVEKMEEQLAKLQMQATDKEENKQIALGTSKLNYLDPRISVAWCKRFCVPIEKIYNKTQREKFAWAIAMVDEDFEF